MSLFLSDCFNSSRNELISDSLKAIICFFNTLLDLHNIIDVLVIWDNRVYNYDLFFLIVVGRNLSCSFKN